MLASDVIGQAVESSIEAIAEPTEEQTQIATEAETPPTQTDDGAVKAAEPAANVEDEEAEIKKIEADLVEKNPLIQKGRIPVHRHQAVVTRTRNKLEAKIKAAEDALAAKVKEFESPEHKRRYEMLRVLEHDPDRGFAALMTHPRYRALIEAEAKKQGVTVTPQGTVEAKAPAKAEPIAEPSEMPKPDWLNADGSVGYTTAQAAKLAAWQTEQAVAKAVAAHKKEIDSLRGEVQPIVDQRKVLQQLEETKNELLPRLQKALDTWPGMKKYYAQFQEGIRKPENSRVGLEDGYRMFVVPLLEAEKNDLAAKIETAKAEGHAAALKDIEQRIPSGTMRPGKQPPVSGEPSTGSFDMESVIKQSIASLRG